MARQWRRMGLGVLTALAWCALTASPAWSQGGPGTASDLEKPDAVTTDGSTLSDEERAYLKEKQDGPSMVYGVGPRIRGVWIADWMLDLGLAKHTSHWQGQTNMEYALEFIMRKPDAYELVFGVSWADISMPAGWWLGKNKDANDADWTTLDLSLLVIDASYYKTWQISEVFSMFLGGGLGLGIFIGDATQEDMGQECFEAVTASENVADLDREPCLRDGTTPNLDPNGTPSDPGIPPVLPWLNLTVGSQFTFAKHYYLRIETGFKGYTFAGLGFGGQWW